MTLRIIAGKFKGRTLKTPKGSSTRPTQGMLREAVFNICQNEIEGARFLDLFAGSGAMGLEAVSRGAIHAMLVESNRQAFSCVKENVKNLKIEDETSLMPVPAERALTMLLKQKARFDIVYVDPPYETPIAPLLGSLLPLLTPRAILFVEERNNPKKEHQPYSIPGLNVKETRRYGIALLTILEVA